MSRLADLLNPAPSSARQSPVPQPIDTAAAPDPARLPSLASPLEGLAIAAMNPSGDMTSTPPANATAHAPMAAMDAVVATPVIKAEVDAPLLRDPGDAAMIDVPVKTEPNESSRIHTHDANLKIEESDPKIKQEPTQPDDLTIPPPPSASILPTTEKARPAPKGAKKANAGRPKKAAPRKRKVDQTSKAGTPISQRSGTPASNRAGKAAATNNAPSSPARSPEEEEEDGDEGVFCVCRGPDDHTWMIGCDGECEDWFHGRCVNMKQEDADLIDKYICPNCAKKGIGVTTWKPMCRLEGCRKPARVTGPMPSKYCSDEHGREFMRQRVMQKSHRSDKQPARKKRHVEEDQAAGTSYSTAEAEGSHQAYLRGGILEAGELKALTHGVKDATDFKSLGEAILPGATNGATPDPLRYDDHGPELTEANDDTCVPEERVHLEKLLARAAHIRHQLGALSDKERLLGLVKARAAQIAAEMGKAAGESKKKDSGKDMCGFDVRLSWSDREFDDWRLSHEGQSALSSGNLGPPPASAAAVDGDGDAVMHDAASDDRAGGLCPKKRCERHKAWYKLHQQEITYDRRECEDSLAKLGHEARGIQERAILKKLEAQGAVPNGTGT